MKEIVSLQPTGWLRETVGWDFRACNDIGLRADFRDEVVRVFDQSFAHISPATLATQTLKR